jgi:hypothetical protein
MDDHAVAGWSIQMGWPPVGCLEGASRPPHLRRVAADPGTSYWDRLEAGSGRIRRAAPHRSNQQHRRAAAFNFCRPPDRGGSALSKPVRRRPARITRSVGQPVTLTPRKSIAVTLANTSAGARRGCDSGSGASCRSASSESLRRSDRSRGVRSLCGRDLELQQDTKRHVFIPRGRALVDRQPRTGRPGSPLSYRSSLDL